MCCLVRSSPDVSLGCQVRPFYKRRPRRGGGGGVATVIMGGGVATLIMLAFVKRLPYHFKNASQEA